MVRPLFYALKDILFVISLTLGTSIILLNYKKPCFLPHCRKAIIKYGGIQDEKEKSLNYLFNAPYRGKAEVLWQNINILTVKTSSPLTYYP